VDHNGDSHVHTHITVVTVVYIRGPWCCQARTKPYRVSTDAVSAEIFVGWFVEQSQEVG
jgi:hypothetical protein